jgi:hypothetical protein
LEFLKKVLGKLVNFWVRCAIFGWRIEAF